MSEFQWSSLQECCCCALGLLRVFGEEIHVFGSIGPAGFCVHVGMCYNKMGICETCKDSGPFISATRSGQFSSTHTHTHTLPTLPTLPHPHASTHANVLPVHIEIDKPQTSSVILIIRVRAVNQCNPQPFLRKPRQENKVDSVTIVIVIPKRTGTTLEKQLSWDHHYPHKPFTEEPQIHTSVPITDQLININGGARFKLLCT